MWPESLNKLQRGRLVTELGGVCSCQGGSCWHEGPCQVTDGRCLQLDHINGDGALDRRRLGGQIGVVRHYLSHLDEARDTLQILCANCNWVKRVRNKEVRNGCGRGADEWGKITSERVLLRMVGCRISSAPRFLELVDKYHGFDQRLVGTVDTDLVSWLESIGLDDGNRCPLTVNLARYWKKLGTYGDSPEEMDRFVNDCIVKLDSLISVQGVREQERCEVSCVT